MQDLVYKLVPGLYQDEMRRRRQFYSGLAEDNSGAGEGEEKGLLPHGARFFAQDDSISLSLEYYTEYVSLVLPPTAFPSPYPHRPFLAAFFPAIGVLS